MTAYLDPDYNVYPDPAYGAPWSWLQRVPWSCLRHTLILITTRTLILLTVYLDGHGGWELTVLWSCLRLTLILLTAYPDPDYNAYTDPAYGVPWSRLRRSLIPLTAYTLILFTTRTLILLMVHLDGHGGWELSLILLIQVSYPDPAYVIPWSCLRRTLMDMEDDKLTLTGRGAAVIVPGVLLGSWLHN